MLLDRKKDSLGDSMLAHSIKRNNVILSADVNSENHQIEKSLLLFTINAEAKGPQLIRNKKLVYFVMGRDFKYLR